MAEKNLDEIRLLQGSKAEFRRFYDLYSGKIYSTAFSYVKSHEDAQEIMQDVFVQLHKSSTSFKGDSRVSTWVYRITVNKSLDFLRRRKSRSRWGITRSIEELPESSDVSVTQEPAESNHLHVLLSAIETLPENQRTAFVLSYVQELPRQEVAEVMDSSLKAVESLLQRAKKKLRERLGNYSFDYIYFFSSF